MGNIQIQHEATITKLLGGVVDSGGTVDAVIRKYHILEMDSLGLGTEHVIEAGNGSILVLGCSAFDHTVHDDQVLVVTDGTVMIEASEAITAGQWVASAAAGRAKVHTGSGEDIVGRALTTVSAPVGSVYEQVAVRLNIHPDLYGRGQV